MAQATADVVIIGGGPAGTAALWAITRAAPELRVVLLEQAEGLGSGSSRASLENFRTCWPTPCLARQMSRSIEVFQQADDYLHEGAAASLALRQQGYLYCGFSEAQAAALRADVDHLHRLGLDHVEFLDAAEVSYRFPWLGPKVRGAKYDPLAGWLDSNALIHAYARAARQQSTGAQVMLGVAGTRILVEGGRVCGVETAGGTISAPQVVLAAGAEARRIGRTAGIDLPLVLRPRQSFTTAWRHESYPVEGPCVIGAAPYPHLRPEAHSGAIFGWEYRWNSKHTRPEAPAQDHLVDPIWPVEALRDPRFPSMTLALLARQFGHQEGEGFATGSGFADGRYLRGVRHNSGYYVYRAPENTYVTAPDGSRQPYTSQRAMIGGWPGLAGLWLSVAHVGHGIMASAAAGEIIAALVLGTALPDPLYADFAPEVHHVAHDAGGLGG